LPLKKLRRRFRMKKSWMLKKCLMGVFLIVPILVFLSTGVAHADRWAMAYGSAQSDQAYSIQETLDGGFIVAGVTDSSGSSAAWVLKLDANGVVTWQKTYGGEGNNYAVYSIQQTADGGYVLAGETYASGASDAWILRLNSNGTVKWQNSYGGMNSDVARSIRQTSDGGYIVAGQTFSFGSLPDGSDGDFWVLKLNGNGNVGPSFAGTWQKTYDVGQNDAAYSIQQTSDGGYVVAGKTGPSGFSDAWVSKLYANGDVDWEKTYGVNNVDAAYSVQETSGGGYIVAGETGSSSDAWVLKLNADGIVIWEKTYGSANVDVARSAEQTSDGGYIVAGETASTASSSDAWVLKLNANGSVAWEKTYGGSNADLARFIRQTSDNGYIVAGETQSFGAGGSDFWVLRIDKNGEIPDCSAMATPSSSVADTTATVTDTTAVMLASTVSGRKSAAVAANTDSDPDQVCYYSEPDLVISSLSAPYSASKGAAIKVTDTTENIGTAGTGTTTTTSFYLSADNILDDGDTLLGGRDDVPALGAGVSDTATTSVTIPSGTATGNYYIIAKADSPDDVIESIENNNTKVKSISIVAVTLLVPNGGEVIPSGGNYAICWNAPIIAEKFTLDLSTDNGSNWTAIKTVIGVGISCTKWEVPAVLLNKKKCRVRVTALDSDNASVGSDISNKPFTIEVLRVTSPNGGETLAAGGLWTIRWLTNKTKFPVTKTILQYKTGASWKPITTLTGNPGSYEWSVPDVTSTTVKVKVILKNGSTVLANDVSDKVFKIQ
jgi:uncharacterized delta-60 repeat protein